MYKRQALGPESKGSQRNLPRLTTSRTLVPTSFFLKSAGPLKCLLRDLESWIFRPVILAPDMDLARPARTVSTSGSSGIYLNEARALMAALVSASFLDRPSAVARIWPSTDKVAKNVRSWSGPSWVIS